MNIHKPIKVFLFVHTEKKTQHREEHEKLFSELYRKTLFVCALSSGRRVKWVFKVNNCSETMKPQITVEAFE